MQEYFSAPVKVYSRYGEPIPAPLGLNAPSNHLELTKWQHFPSITQIMFIVLRDGTHTIFKVVWDGTTLEFAPVDLKDGNSVIQFSVKSPSMSCKYMDTPKYMKRFQLTFNNESDFIRACNLISNLGFIVKEARPSVSERSRMAPPGLQALLSTQCSSQTPLQNMLSQQPLHENSVSLSQCAPDISTSFFERSGFRRLTEQSYKHPKSPLVELSEQPEHFSKRNVIPLESPKINSPLMTHKKVSTLPATQPLDNPYSLPVGQLTQSLKRPTTLSQPSPQRPVCEFAPPPFRKPVATTALPDNVLNTANRREEGSAAICCNEEPGAFEAAKLHAHPLASAAIPQTLESPRILVREQKGLLENLDSNKSSKVASPEVKISKKLIKQKLKDKKFLKWVSKVEAVLTELAGGKSS